jgi:glucose-1-phosphate thymidylyltransferase
LGALRPTSEGAIDDGSTVDGMVALGPGAKVIRSRIVGPVWIGPETVIEDSTIGPDVSIERDCVVQRSEIRNSIVMGECRIHGVDGIADSILGRGAEVRRSGVPGTRRLVVGDHGRVEFD